MSKKILLVDPDKKLLNKLGKRLTKGHFSVKTAIDGANALESALLEKPDLVLTNYHLPMFDGERLRSFMRNNPTTTHIPFIFLIDADRGEDETLARIGPDGSLVKPFRWQDVNRKIDEAFNPREESGPGIKEAGTGIEGDLKEVSLVDLLQIFSLNRRTGVLVLRRDDLKARISLKDGELLHSELGEIEGEKALFRILRWNEGSFQYRPGDVNTKVRRSINRNMDALLMEGMRQLDEWDSLKDKIPPDGTILKLNKDTDELPSDLRPVTQEILLLLEFYEKMGDIVDKATHTDYDVCRSLLGLLQKGIVSISSSGTYTPAVRGEPLITPEQVLEMCKILNSGEGTQQGTYWGKILLFSTEPGLMTPFLADATSMEEFKLTRDNFSNQEILNASFGGLGTLDLSEKSKLHLFVMPIGTGNHPLWDAFSEGAIGAVLLKGNGDIVEEEIATITDFMEITLQKPCVFTTLAEDEDGNAPGTATISFTSLFEMILSQNKTIQKESVQ